MRRTFRKDARSGAYVSSDGRYEIVPAYAPSIRGGSVTRPSYWILYDGRTGEHLGTHYSGFADLRRYAQELP